MVYLAAWYFRGGNWHHWPITLPAWSVVVGFIGGLAEWQIDDTTDELQA